MEISGPVEPGLLAESCHVDNQRIPFPMAARPTHPRISGSLPLPIHTDAPSGARELIGDQDVWARTLDDLKGKRHIRRAWHSRQITFELRVAKVVPLLVVGDVNHHPFFAVLLPLRQRPRLVWDLTVLHHTLSRGLLAGGTHELGKRSRLPLMVLNVQIGRDESLPQTVQVGLTVGHTGRPV